MVSVVVCCVYLLLISNDYFSNKGWTQPFTEYAMLFSIPLVHLAYDGWALRVIFGCKRYFEDKSKAKIMKVMLVQKSTAVVNNMDTAPRPNAELLTHGQVNPPPYQHKS